MFEESRQLSFFQPTSWSVREITRYLRDLLERDPHLQDVWVRGEVSNFSRPRSGHIYFTIKDEFASLRCVMWKSSITRHTFIPQDGDEVEVHGTITIYEAGGQYQLYADDIQPIGKGALYQEFLRLKESLQAEGLFDEARKRPIPPFPQTIGVVTSATGAALRDILNTLRRRYPLAEVILSPTPVQGDGAPPKIVSAIEALNRIIHPDVIILARGGGSIEDLWAFNDPTVAHAIADSKAPVITGIGHQTDFTIADFVADLRAPTPTAAAELATPNQSDLKSDILDLEQHLTNAVFSKIETEHWRTQNQLHQLEMLSPIGYIQSNKQRIYEIKNRIQIYLEHKIKYQQNSLHGYIQRLTSLNPKAVLNRGYAIVAAENGKIIRSTQQIQIKDTVKIQVAKGEFNAKVTKINNSSRKPER